MRDEETRLQSQSALFVRSALALRWFHCVTGSSLLSRPVAAATTAVDAKLRAVHCLSLTPTSLKSVRIFISLQNKDFFTASFL